MADVLVHLLGLEADELTAVGFLLAFIVGLLVDRRRLTNRLSALEAENARLVERAEKASERRERTLDTLIRHNMRSPEEEADEHH